MLGHATGRLLLRRDGYEVDLEAVLQAAAEHGTHDRDQRPSACGSTSTGFTASGRKALGVKLVINPDAHSSTIWPCTATASTCARGWLTKDDVFNTLSAAEVTKAPGAGKKAAD